MYGQEVDESNWLASGVPGAEGNERAECKGVEGAMDAACAM